MTLHRKKRKKKRNRDQTENPAAPLIRLVLQGVAVAVFVFLIQRTYDRLNSYEATRWQIQYLDSEASAAQNSGRVRLTIYKLGPSSVRKLAFSVPLLVEKQKDFEITSARLLKYEKGCFTSIFSRRQYLPAPEANRVTDDEMDKHVNINFDNIDKDWLYELTIDIRSKSGKPIQPPLFVPPDFRNDQDEIVVSTQPSWRDKFILCLDEFYFASLLLLIVVIIVTWKISKRLTRV